MRTGRGMRESPRRGIRRRVAMAKKLSSRRKLLRMAAQRMGLAMSRKDQNPRAGKEKGQSHVITRARRARGTGTRGRRSRGITIRKRRDMRTRRKKRPRQLTWRYPILREEGKSAILSDFRVAFYTSYRLTSSGAC